MSLFDAEVSTFLWLFLLSSISILALFLIRLMLVKPPHQKLLPYINSLIFDDYLAALADAKKDLFKDLESMKSLNQHFKAKGWLRVLEVGTGPGTNFRFYPHTSVLYAVEPNRKFIKQMLEDEDKYPNICLYKAIVGKAEHIPEVEDNSIDVVVVTLVLCSVDNIDDCLKEFHRVLAPGGKLYFLEHGHGVRETWQKCLQTVINPLWSLLFYGCHLDRNVMDNITNSGLFVNICSKDYTPLSLIKWVNLCLGLHVYGTAEKSPLVLDRWAYNGARTKRIKRGAPRYHSA